MVLQRIQSLYLLIAAILMAVFGYFTAVSFELPILVGVIAFLAIVDIFLYKNLQRQMTVCFVDIILGLAMLVAIGYQAYHLSADEGAKLSWSWLYLLPILSIVFLMLAHKAMSRDKKKLLDADRLR